MIFGHSPRQGPGYIGAMSSVSTALAAHQTIYSSIGAQPPQNAVEWPLASGFPWPKGGGLGFNNVHMQTRAMERAAGLGNNVDMFV